MSNKKISDKDVAKIEKDVNFIEEMIKEYKTFGDLYNPDFEDTEKIYKALENILAERKQDKKYIKNLEISLKIIKKLSVVDLTEEKNILILRKAQELLEGEKK